MIRRPDRIAALVLCAATLAWPAVGAPRQAPTRLLLVGDSTVSKTTGYGDALCGRVGAADCVNLARGGRSTAGFRSDGSWARVTAALRDTGPWKATYVTIQFGHNDQPGRAGQSTDLATGFTANLVAYIKEIREAGAKPILVTPLCRRRFVGGELQDTLEPWAEAVRRVGAQEKTPVIDLHAWCLQKLEAMGPDASAGLGPTHQGSVHTDYTHLGPAGAELFADYMQAQLRSLVPALGAGG